MKKIGWIGLGAMGTPMATNLQKAGFDMQVYNRTQGKAASLVSLGAIEHSSPLSVISASDVTFLMLTNADAIHEVLTKENGVLGVCRSWNIGMNLQFGQHASIITY